MECFSVVDLCVESESSPEEEKSSLLYSGVFFPFAALALINAILKYKMQTFRRFNLR
jgi:hypothetical protein